MSSDDVLLYQADGAIATITLNRPKFYNAFDPELRSRMRETVASIEADDQVRIVIIKGEGRGFSAGADLTQGIDHPVNERLDREYKPFLTAIAESNKIYIAQVHGAAAGIGAAVAMNCDLVVMADTASVYMAFAAIALIPDGGNTWLLLKQMGYHRALEAVLEGQKITASECLESGIANKVVSVDDLESVTQEWAEKLATGAPMAMAAAKRLLRQVGHHTYADAISIEGLEQNPLAESNDFTIGTQAFFNKEKPQFKGN